MIDHRRSTIILSQQEVIICKLPMLMVDVGDAAPTGYYTKEPLK